MRHYLLLAIPKCNTTHCIETSVEWTSPLNIEKWQRLVQLEISTPCVAFCTLSPCVFFSSPCSAPDCGANPGWRKNNNICYYYNDTDIVDFHTAMRRCYEEKASLVSILNKDEQAYVNTMVRLSLRTCCTMSQWNVFGTRCSCVQGGDRPGGFSLDWDEDVWHHRWTIHVCVIRSLPLYFTINYSQV